LSEADRHDFRRSVRWWRYLRELTLSRRKAHGDAQLRRLLAVQEATGELQNLALVEAALRRLTPGGEVEELRKLLARQQGAMRVTCQQALAALRVKVR
jgi:CHAD domain-containing protein